MKNMQKLLAKTKWHFWGTACRSHCRHLNNNVRNRTNPNEISIH